ncbi:MAG: hypothetical protein U0M72_07605 [Eggerthellaceae bacterium]
MKIGSAIIGFIMICIGICNLAGHVPFLGIHPAVWFILGAGLLLSDTAWEKLSHRKKDDPNTPDGHTTSSHQSPTHDSDPSATDTTIGSQPGDRTSASKESH